MSEMTFDSAAEALAAANNDAAVSAPAAETVVSTPAAPAATEQAPAASPTTEQGPTSEESFTNVDLSTLPPELQALGKNLLGDYTRKTQEIAPYRQTLQEYGMTAEDARQAVELTRQLQDPAVQRELYDRLSAQYENEGAAEYEEEGVVDDPRDRAISSLEQRLQAFETQQLRGQIADHLNQQEARIRSENPDFQDKDIRRIEQLAFAHQGDMLAAATEYRSLREDILGGYVAEKGSVVAGTGVAVGSTPHSQDVQAYKTLEEAHPAALAAFIAAQGE